MFSNFDFGAIVSALPYLFLTGMVFTLEPRLTVPGKGVVTIEEMVLVTKQGAEYLGPPQTELVLI